MSQLLEVCWPLISSPACGGGGDITTWSSSHYTGTHWDIFRPLTVHNVITDGIFPYGVTWSSHWDSPRWSSLLTQSLIEMCKLAGQINFVVGRRQREREREREGDWEEEGPLRNLLVKPRSDWLRSKVGSSHGEASLLGWSFAAGSSRERVEPGGGFSQPVC